LKEFLPDTLSPITQGILTSYKDRSSLPAELLTTWVRIASFFIIQDMPTYHKLCQAYSINKASDFQGSFEWIVGKQYGPINNERPPNEENLPAGFASAGLCRLVKEHCNAATL